MEAKKVILIILTIFILGPLVFVGSCFPTGFLGWTLYDALNLHFPNDIQVVIIPISLLCLALAIFVCYKIIKIIVKPKSDNINHDNSTN